MRSRRLVGVLRECIQDIESGARPLEECVAAYPMDESELHGHLTLWQRLVTLPRAEPRFAGQQRVQQRLLAEIRGEQRGRTAPFFEGLVARAVVVVVSVTLLTVGVAGASAALGGPNVFSGVGITRDGRGQQMPPASPTATPTPTNSVPAMPAPQQQLTPVPQHPSDHGPEMWPTPWEQMPEPGMMATPWDSRQGPEPMATPWDDGYGPGMMATPWGDGRQPGMMTTPWNGGWQGR